MLIDFIVAFLQLHSAILIRVISFMERKSGISIKRSHFIIYAMNLILSAFSIKTVAKNMDSMGVVLKVEGRKKTAKCHYHLWHQYYSRDLSFSSRFHLNIIFSSYD